MKSTSKRVKIGSLWAFRHSTPSVIVRVFSIEKIHVEEKLGKTIKKKSYIQIEYGLRNAASGHVCQSINGFLENYEWRRNAS